MAIDEELLKPSREHLVQLRAQIAALEAETHEKIKLYDDESVMIDHQRYAKELWRNFNLAVEPLRREQEAVLKVITDYYALQPMPPQILAPPTTILD